MFRPEINQFLSDLQRQADLLVLENFNFYIETYALSTEEPYVPITLDQIYAKISELNPRDPYQFYVELTRFLSEWAVHITEDNLDETPYGGQGQGGGPYTLFNLHHMRAQPPHYRHPPTGYTTVAKQIKLVVLHFLNSEMERTTREDTLRSATQKQVFNPDYLNGPRYPPRRNRDPPFTL